MATALAKESGFGPKPDISLFSGATCFFLKVKGISRPETPCSAALLGGEQYSLHRKYTNPKKGMEKSSIFRAALFVLWCRTSSACNPINQE